MSMLAFFPWLRLNTRKLKLKIGDIILLRFDRKNRLPFRCVRGVQGICDKVLESYISENGSPVAECSLVSLRGKKILEDIEEKEINYLYSVVEVITFSGLAKRELFSSTGLGYCNTDDFAFFVHRFSNNDDPSLRAITSRRRDGSTTSFATPGVHKIKKPFHTNPYSFFGVELDTTLAQALLEAQERLQVETWLRYSDAIFNFNRANTDSPAISEHQEVVMTIGAFQRLLDSGHKENELVRKFQGIFQPSKDLDTKSSRRIGNCDRHGKDMTLRETWLRDFCHMRADYAHGRTKSNRPSLWTAREHLLLGSYIFPLLVKCLLSNDGLYKLTSSDGCGINAFEKLADSDFFGDRKQWNQILLQEILRATFSLSLLL